MKSLEELLKIVKRANKNQLWHMIHDFEWIGFYREDKRQQRQFIIDCLTNCYKTELNQYGIHDDDSLRMERAVVAAMLHK